MEESENLAGEIPASEPEATAAPEPESAQGAEAVDTPVAEPKTFTQEELDAVVSKRLARERRNWERSQQPAPEPAVNLPPIDQFETVDAYAEARALQLIQQREQQREQAQILEGYNEREEAAREKFDDFEQVAYNPNLKITQVMAQAIQSSEVGPEVAYHLGTNPKEAERISKLAPILQAREIGKLEAKLSDAPPVKKTSSAPAPISPVKAPSSGGTVYDTTDPRSIKNMSTSEWIEAERQRQIRQAKR
jgi:hypothetical protein